MQVLLIRHAEGVAETLALPDPTRYLSPVGRGQARALGDQLRRGDRIPTAIWSSPLVRAVQTAELVIAALAWPGDLVVQPDLAPGGDLRRIQHALAERAALDVVAIVGHEPALSGLGGVLTGAAIFVALRKAEAACIDGGRETWRLAHDSSQPT